MMANPYTTNALYSIHPPNSFRTSAHKSNAMVPPPRRRPQTAPQRKRPQTAPASRPANNRPNAADQRTLDVIYGRSGPPPMRGVLSYTFSPTQRIYREEFETILAGQLTHPFLSVTQRQLQSCPHDLISGARSPREPGPDSPY